MLKETKEGLIKTTIVIAGAVSVGLILRSAINSSYNEAVELYDSGDYDNALVKFEILGDYRDKNSYVEKINIALDYEDALNLYYRGKYTEADEIFTRLGGYEDADVFKSLCSVRNTDEYKKVIYDFAVEKFNNKEYALALESFSTISDYKDSSWYMANIALIEK